MRQFWRRTEFRPPPRTPGLAHALVLYRSVIGRRFQARRSLNLSELVFGHLQIFNAWAEICAPALVHSGPDEEQALAVLFVRQRR